MTGNSQLKLLCFYMFENTKEKILAGFTEEFFINNDFEALSEQLMLDGCNQETVVAIVESAMAAFRGTYELDGVSDEDLATAISECLSDFMRAQGLQFRKKLQTEIDKKGVHFKEYANDKVFQNEDALLSIASTFDPYKPDAWDVLSRELNQCVNKIVEEYSHGRSNRLDISTAAMKCIASGAIWDLIYPEISRKTE